MQKTAALVLTPLLLAFAATADTPQGLSDAQFDHALRNISTAPNYVLFTVRDLSTGSNQPVCVEAEFLASALINEHGLKLDQVVPFALTQPDRTFSFTNAAALSSLKPAYSPAILDEARAFLSKFTTPQLVAATRDQDSKFYEFCAREPGAYSARFPALAHVLSEQGILCTRGCKPGIFDIETNRIRLAPATAPLKEELVPVLFNRIEKKEGVELKLLTQALVGTQLTLRAYAASASEIQVIPKRSHSSSTRFTMTPCMWVPFTVIQATTPPVIAPTRRSRSSPARISAIFGTIPCRNGKRPLPNGPAGTSSRSNRRAPQSNSTPSQALGRVTGIAARLRRPSLRKVPFATVCCL